MAPITYNFRLDTQLSKRKTVERVYSAKVSGKKPKNTAFLSRPFTALQSAFAGHREVIHVRAVVCVSVPKPEKVPGQLSKCTNDFMSTFARKNETKKNKRIVVNERKKTHTFFWLR